MTKIVLVTGASSGIGRAIAEVLANAGHTVYGASRKAISGTVINNVAQLSMDVTDEQSVQAAIQLILEKEKRIDVVVNNAGLGMIGAVENTTDAEVRKIFDTNVNGVLNVCRQVLPAMRKQQEGYIINVTSIAGLMGLPFRGIYSASKHAVEGFSESLSQEVRSFGIKVVVIEPGDFNTNINQNRLIASKSDGAYSQFESKVLHQINHEVSHAPHPKMIGTTILKILRKKNPRLRYKVATPFQKFSVLVRDIIPDRWFESLVMKFYKV